MALEGRLKNYIKSNSERKYYLRSLLARKQLIPDNKKKTGFV